jgi:hypothetical protein
MTARQGTKSAPPPSHRRSRRRLALLGTAGTIVIVAALLVIVSRDGSGEGDVEGAQTASAAIGDPTGETDPPVSTVVPPTSPSATLPVDGPEVGVNTLAPVGRGEAGTFESGLAVQVVDVTEIDAQAVLPGETAGPAVVVEIEARNAGQSEVDLIGFVVTAGDGQGTPLVMNSSEPAAPLDGVLAPGEARTGRYVFRVAGDPSVVVRIEDGLSPDAIIVEI